MTFLKFIKALIKFILYGDVVTREEKTRRLRMCVTCKSRCNKKCCICGCTLAKKAEWNSEHCPLKKW